MSIRGDFHPVDKTPDPSAQTSSEVEVKKKEHKGPPAFVKAFASQFKNDMGALLHLAFGSAIETDQSLKELKELQAKIPQTPKIQGEIKALQRKITHCILASIFIMPFTAIAAAPLLPLWTLLSLVNASSKAATGSNLNEGVRRKGGDVSDWHVKNQMTKPP